MNLQLELNTAVPVHGVENVTEAVRESGDVEEDDLPEDSKSAAMVVWIMIICVCILKIVFVNSRYGRTLNARAFRNNAVSKRGHSREDCDEADQSYLHLKLRETIIALIYKLFDTKNRRKNRVQKRENTRQPSYLSYLSGEERLCGLPTDLQNHSSTNDPLFTAPTETSIRNEQPQPTEVTAQYNSIDSDKPAFVSGLFDEPSNPAVVINPQDVESTIHTVSGFKGQESNDEHDIGAACLNNSLPLYESIESDERIDIARAEDPENSVSSVLFKEHKNCESWNLQMEKEKQPDELRRLANELEHHLFTEDDVREADRKVGEFEHLVNLFHTPTNQSLLGDTTSKFKEFAEGTLDEIENRLAGIGCEVSGVKSNLPFLTKAAEFPPQQQKSVSNKSKMFADEKVNELEDRLTSSGVWLSDERKTHEIKSDEWEKLFHGLSSVRSHHFAPAEQDLFCYPVPRYPDNHNPLLPLALQKKLDYMSPREFLSYVLNDLTLEERESLMVDEKQRRKTFQVNWPHGDNLSGVKMAQAGFYCVDDFDRVQCVFCRGCLHRWEPDDVPMSEHARSFNFCRFVKGLECGNREFKDEVLLRDELKNVTLFITPELKKNRDGSVATDSSIFGFSTNKADTIQYAPNPSRMRTFSRWPANSPIPAKKLCDAGFYYTGFNDQVRCFYCSGGLGEWKVSDDPFEEHARWFPECDFLIQQKGQMWIDQVHDRTPPNKKAKRATVLQKTIEIEEKQRESDQEVMIAICLKLGHDKWSIDRAIKRNGGPFSRVQDMIESIYDIEDNGDTGIGLDDVDGGMMAKSGMTDSGYLSMDSIDSSFPSNKFSKITKMLSEIPEEDRDKYSQLASEDVLPGAMDNGKYRPPPLASCRVCYKKTGQTITGTHVGLPCGHMIFCDKCSAEEKSKVVKDSTHKPKCPYLKCGAPLTGSLKAYLN